MNTTAPSGLAGLSRAALVVAIRAAPDHPILGREPIRQTDLDPLLAECWMNGCLRQGNPHIALEDLTFAVHPTPAARPSEPCPGVDVEVTHPAAARVTLRFPATVFELTARRATPRLVQQGLLEENQSFCFQLVVEAGPPDAASEPAGFPPLVPPPAPPPLNRISYPLAPLRKSARREGPAPSGEYPVFFTAAAQAAAESMCREGAARQPPVETGGVLVGALGSCPDSGELFAVLFDALEARDSEQTTWSLHFSGRSWHRIETIMKRRAAGPRTRFHQVLGQCHGHNWIPNGGQVCSSCAHRAVCTASNTGLSLDDIRWMRSVFHRQPWALGLIHGYTARRDAVHVLYGFARGRLAPRGYYRLDRLPPDLDRRLGRSSAFPEEIP
jgi:hypothetical protein